MDRKGQGELKVGPVQEVASGGSEDQDSRTKDTQASVFGSLQLIPGGPEGWVLTWGSWNGLRRADQSQPYLRVGVHDRHERVMNSRAGL